MCVTGICCKLILVKRLNHFLLNYVTHGLVLHSCVASHLGLKAEVHSQSGSDTSLYIAVGIIKFRQLDLDTC